MRLPLLVFACALALVVSGCATITKGTTQTVTVATDPAGATCKLTRDGQPLAVVNPTPGSIPIERGRGTIAVDCRRDGYLEASGAMSSEFQAMTFGNILFGGLIGVAVDAASGAMHEYPAMVTITLIPEQFDTAATRDAFFERMKATLLQESKEVKERIAKECRDPRCRPELEAADAATKQKLAEIEQKRSSARVKGP
ncbi:MAG: hypothetical protein U1F54_10015 [Burkholderiales bacterium]